MFNRIKDFLSKLFYKFFPKKIPALTGHVSPTFEQYCPPFFMDDLNKHGNTGIVSVTLNEFPPFEAIIPNEKIPNASSGTITFLDGSHTGTGVGFQSFDKPKKKSKKPAKKKSKKKSKK